MSQAGRFSFGGSGKNTIVAQIIADSGTASASNYILNAIGGSNINTAGSSNNVTVYLDNSITVSSGSIGSIDITNNIVSSNVLDGNIVFLPNGTGNIIYDDSDAQSNASYYFDSSNQLKSISLADGQLLIGRTGNSPAAGNIVAGDNIQVTNGANNITISSLKSGGAGLKWNYINANDYDPLIDVSLTMARNNGYIVKWWPPVDGAPYPGAPTQPAKLELTFPSASTLSIGDLFFIVVVSSYSISTGTTGSPHDITGANVRISPGSYGVQANFVQDGDLYVDNLNTPLAIVPFLSFISNATSPYAFPDGSPSFRYLSTISFMYVGNQYNVSGSTRDILQVITANASWNYNAWNNTP